MIIISMCLFVCLFYCIKHKFWARERKVSLRRLFHARKTYYVIKGDGNPDDYYVLYEKILINQFHRNRLNHAEVVDV